MATNENTDAPRVIHCLWRAGWQYIAFLNDADPFTARPGRLEFGDTLELTDDLLRWNEWLGYSSEEQDREFGPDRHKFGYGEVPQHVRADLAAVRRADLQEKRNFLLQANPRVRQASAATAALAKVEADLAALDLDGQSS